MKWKRSQTHVAQILAGVLSAPSLGQGEENCVSYFCFQILGKMMCPNFAAWKNNFLIFYLFSIDRRYKYWRKVFMISLTWASRQIGPLESSRPKKLFNFGIWYEMSRNETSIISTYVLCFFITKDIKIILFMYFFSW